MRGRSWGLGSRPSVVTVGRKGRGGGAELPEEFGVRAGTHPPALAAAGLLERLSGM